MDIRSGSTVRRTGLGLAAAWLSAVSVVGTQGSAQKPGAAARQTPVARPAPVAAVQPATPPGLTSEAARSTLEKYCATCHNDRAKAGGLSLAAVDPAKVAGHAEVWEKVVRKLKTGAMPPAGMPRPAAATADSLTAWLESELDRTAAEYPGRPVLRRLNRAEYANAIRDVLDLRVDVKALLPPDDSAFGFDNVGDLLVVSPSLLERYLDAADRVSALAVGDPDIALAAETFTVRGDQSQDHHIEGLPLGTVGGLAVPYNAPLDGEYEFSLTLFRTNTEGMRGLEHVHQLEIAVDGERVFLGAVGGDADSGLQNRGRSEESVTDRSDAIDARLKVRVPLKAGPRVLTATFVQKSGFGTNRLRPFVRSNSGTYDATGRPHIESMTVTGPYAPTGPGDTPSRRRVFSCRPATPDAAAERQCATQILSTLARRAYRRPVTTADRTRLLAFFDEGRKKGSFDAGIQLALRRLLASPSFVFRVEDDPNGPTAGKARPVTDLELATRLSFFLWSTIPDEELLTLASERRLSQPAVLRAQVRRMLKDARGEAFVENFAGQWLHLRNLSTIAPNSDEFPDFDDDLRQAFRKEAELFFASIIDEDRSVLDLMTADYSFVNQRLARHYGLSGITGSHFRRVTLPDDARRGLLGKGSVLLATSHADRTAPVVRGKWVMENLLGSPPPPPPPNVPALTTEPGKAPKTMRERMEAHRANPACASCHKAMDPIGFAMENMDAIGAWRTMDAGVPIDASGQLTDGTPINGVSSLRNALMRKPVVIVETLTEKLMIYALGRGLQAEDMPTVRRIVRASAPGGYRFSALIQGIIDSPAFRMRGASQEAAPEGTRATK
jgi:mono/diheme cytochrome c family protein